MPMSILRLMGKEIKDAFPIIQAPTGEAEAAAELLATGVI